MNNLSLVKFTVVMAAVAVAMTAIAPQKVLAQETGTVPIIKSQSESNLSGVKDTSTIPIVASPSSNDVTAPQNNAPDDESFTVTVTVNAPVTQATNLDIDVTHPHAVSAPDSVTVQPGSSTVTFTVGVRAGYAAHHKNVKFTVSCNGQSTDCTVRVHYHGEND